MRLEMSTTRSILPKFLRYTLKGDSALAMNTP
jgi:hypothetical protein